MANNKSKWMTTSAYISEFNISLYDLSDMHTLLALICEAIASLSWMPIEREVECIAVFCSKPFEDLHEVSLLQE